MINIKKDLMARPFGLFEVFLTKVGARCDIRKGTAAIDNEGKIDSPALRVIREEATEVKARLFEYCAELTAKPRLLLPGDKNKLSALEEKAETLEKELALINIPQPSPEGMPAEMIVDIRKLRQKHAAKQAELSATKVMLERLREDIDEALRELRQIEEEILLAACAVEARAYKKMNIYVTAAGRKAKKYIVLTKTQEEIFPAIAEELYTFLNRREDLPAREIYL